MTSTANPRAPQVHPSDAPQEPTGTVASDSLAADSINADGGFAKNEHAAISSVRGANSTLNNTDTSAASVLQPSSDSSTRDNQDAQSAGSDERGKAGLKYPDSGEPSSRTGPSQSQSGNETSGASGDTFTNSSAPSGGFGQTPDPNIKSQGSADPTPSASTDKTSSTATATCDSSSSTTTAGVRPYVDQAPTYTATVSGSNRPEGELKPKGTNLTEGDVPQTKTFTGDVGGPHDPGRLAEGGFQKINANTAGGAAGRGGGEGADASEQGDGQGQSTGQYDVLESERA